MKHTSPTPYAQQVARLPYDLYQAMCAVADRLGISRNRAMTEAVELWVKLREEDKDNESLRGGELDG